MKTLIKIKKCSFCNYLYQGYRRCPYCDKKMFSYLFVDYKAEKWKPNIHIERLNES